MNMTYCRFHNTSIDLSDCLAAISEREKGSESEVNACGRMFKEFLEFCEDNGIIDSYNPKALKDMLDDITE